MFPLKSTALVLALAAVSISTATADPRRPRSQNSRTARLRMASVPLQPFSMRSPSRAMARMQMSYYMPRAVVRHPDSVDRNDDHESSPEVESSGSRPVVSGNRAVLRNGVAYAPANAPDRVKSAIWAVNAIRRKPYHWGGGHGSFQDSGYDCSGTVSFALHHAGVLDQPMPSRDFLRFGERGRGRWITVYSRRGHTFAMIAGLRLDTTDFRTGRDVGPRWHNQGRETRGFQARHPGGL